MCYRCGKANGIENGATPNNNHIAAPIEVGGMKAFEHLFQDVNVIFYCLPTRYFLDVSNAKNLISIAVRKTTNLFQKSGVGVSNIFIDPKLDSRWSIAGGCEDLS